MIGLGSNQNECWKILPQMFLKKINKIWIKLISISSVQAQNPYFWLKDFQGIEILAKITETRRFGERCKKRYRKSGPFWLIWFQSQNPFGIFFVFMTRSSLIGHTFLYFFLHPSISRLIFRSKCVKEVSALFLKNFQCQTKMWIQFCLKNATRE